MTQNISVQRAIDNTDAIEALDAALKAALGSKCYGLAYHDGMVTLYLADDAKADDQNTAVQIVNTFDLNTRTPEQIERAEAKAAIAAFKEQADTVVSDLAAAKDQIGKAQTAEEVIIALTDQVATLTDMMVKVMERLRL